MGEAGAGHQLGDRGAAHGLPPAHREPSLTTAATPRGWDRTDSAAALAVLLLTAVLYVTVFGTMPVYRDALGYGYRSARWMAENGLTPIPRGDLRGESCMGHPALFFWLWAVVMRTAGDTVWTVHLLPAIATAMALMGAWRLGRLLGGRTAGVISAAGSS